MILSNVRGSASNTDAAATLLACDALWGTAFPREDMLELAAELGAELGISVKTVETHRARMMEALGRDSLPLISQDGFQFKDFNRNGTLEPFEDWRRSPEARAADDDGRRPAGEGFLERAAVKEAGLERAVDDGALDQRADQRRAHP